MPRLQQPLRLALLALLVIAAAVTAAPARAQGNWLDAPLTSWNRAGAPVPTAPPANASGNDSFCANQQRPPETAEDRALASAGWRLFGSYQSGWGIRVIGAQADEDGMCRPLSYNYFVFISGQFAGTVSPVLMNSRTDGAAQAPSILDGGTLTANFDRYTPNDALCCPSATSTVMYAVAGGVGGNVIGATSAMTTRNGP